MVMDLVVLLTSVDWIMQVKVAGLNQFNVCSVVVARDVKKRVIGEMCN